MAAPPDLNTGVPVRAGGVFDRGDREGEEKLEVDDRDESREEERDDW